MPKRIEPLKIYIYRLTCKSPNVNDSYISFTTNIFQRKCKHKRECSDLSNQDFLYQHIRKYGNWKNWNLEILEECPNEQPIINERILYFISKFKPNIFDEKVTVVSNPGEFNNNKSNNIPFQTEVFLDNKYVCLCKKSYAHRSSYYKHTSSCLQFQQNKTEHIGNADIAVKDIKPHLLSSGESIENNESNHNDYYSLDIDNIDYNSPPYFPTFPQTPAVATFPVNNHETNSHHKPAKIVNDSTKYNLPASTFVATDEEDIHTVSELLTEQNEKLKEYIRQMMAVFTLNKKQNKKSLVNSLVFELLDQNKTLQKQIIELSKERNIVVNNTNNNQFNLNFFLNEQCKDAVNLTDFVNSLEITLDDLTYTRNQGLVEGISKVMIDGLKQMDLYKRPIHCTDQKRDTIYIKDNHTWARDEGNIRMKKAFVDIANKEYFAIKMWMDSNPGWESNSSLQDFHHKMVKNVLHEIREDPIGERKILKNIEREIFIEK